MEHAYCLNCEKRVENNFCSHCGQKTDTHRITIKHFIAHDLLHGVWHIEKGLFFTLKQAVLRPGKAALDYVNGKRVRYYNVFYLALLLIGFNALLLHGYREMYHAADEGQGKELNKILANYSKVFILSIVPLLALNAKLVFRKWKLNLAEHFIVSGMALLGILLATAVLWLLQIVLIYVGFEAFGVLTVTLLFLIPLTPVWTYLNAFKSKYSIWGISWRMVLFYLLVLLEIIAVFVGIILVFANGNAGVDFTF